MRQLVLLLLPFTLALTFLSEEADECSSRLRMICPDEEVEQLLFGGIAKKLTCLTSNHAELGNDCFISAMQTAMTTLEEVSSDKPCSDELHKKCGKVIDELKKQIQDTSVIGIIKASVDVVDCIAHNAEDLWKKCNPFEIKESVKQNECLEKAVSVCPPSQSKVMGLGFTLGCLAEQAPVLGVECARVAISAVLEDLENVEEQDKECKDELRKKCGKEIDYLKKEVQDTSVIGIIKGAVDVVQCVAQNAEDLWKKCSPFEEESVVEVAPQSDIALNGGAPTPPTRKPTRKPTKKTSKPTKKPTKFPTKKPTVKPTGTKVPTAKKIMEELVLNIAPNLGSNVMEGSNLVEESNSVQDQSTMYDDDDDEDEILEETSESQPETPRAALLEPATLIRPNAIEVTRVEVDLERCVEAAQQICYKEVLEVKSSFAVEAMEALGACIEANTEAIESICIVSRSKGFFSYSESWTSSFRDPFSNYAMMHPPCRHHHEDITLENQHLPRCHHPHHHHHCHGKVGFILVGLFFMVLAAAHIRRRRRQACCVNKQPSKAQEGQVLREPLMMKGEKCENV